jgi:hypothetical protein
MSDAMHTFSIEELEQLDPNQLEFLRRALVREVRTNPEIHRILRERIQPLYDRMAAQTTQARSRRPRTRRTTSPDT